MIYIRDEGEQIRQGFNIYPRSNLYSKGFILRIGKIQFMCRYSVIQKRWIMYWSKV